MNCVKSVLFLRQQSVFSWSSRPRYSISERIVPYCHEVCPDVICLWFSTIGKAFLEDLHGLRLILVQVYLLRDLGRFSGFEYQLGCAELFIFQDQVRVAVGVVERELFRCDDSDANLYISLDCKFALVHQFGGHRADVERAY